MPSKTRESQTFAALWESALRLELLDAQQVEEMRRRKTPANTKELGKELVSRGWLTQFQCDEMLQGRGEQLFFGQYCLLEPLGGGGMGQVFKARHRLMRRVVALKVMRENLLSLPEAQQRFRREIELAAQLRHPNIVTAYDAEQVGQRHCLVMEYCEGKTLADVVRQIGPLPVPQACTYIYHAAQGLQHAHARGMIHRDIKPENLLLTQGTIKILDFGLARLRDPLAPESKLTRMGTVMGTPDFMAPEQAQGLHAADARSDLYSLGCTFYFLVAGRVPFLGGTAAEKLLRQQVEDAPPLAGIRTDVPPSVQAIVKVLMAKDPAKRYQTARDLAAVLEPLAQYEIPSTDCSALTQEPMKAAASEGWSEGAVATYMAPAPPPQAPPRQALAPQRPIVSLDTFKGRTGGRAAESRGRWRLLAAAGGLVGIIILSISLWARWGGSGAVPQKAPIAARGVAPSARPVSAPTPRSWNWQVAIKEQMTSGQVRALALAPYGKRLAVGYGRRKDSKLPGEVFLWQVGNESLTLRKSWPTPSGVGGVAFSQDAKFFAWALADSPMITLWDIDKQQEFTLDGHPKGNASLAFSPDGLLVAGTSEATLGNSAIGLWEAASGERLGLLKVTSGRINGVAFTPDGRFLVGGITSNRSIWLWDFPKRKPLAVEKRVTTGVVLSVAISPDAKTVAAGFQAGTTGEVRSKPGIKLWDIATLRPHDALLYEGDAPHALAFTPDGQALVAGHEDGKVRVFRLESKQEEVLEGHEKAVWGLDLSRDGAVLATASLDQTVRVWFRTEK